MIRMTEAQQGKPFCIKAKMFLKGRILPQCQVCDNIVYIGCPAFEPAKIRLKKAVDYIKWFIGNLCNEAD